MIYWKLKNEFLSQSKSQIPKNILFLAPVDEKTSYGNDSKSSSSMNTYLMIELTDLKLNLWMECVPEWITSSGGLMLWGRREIQFG